MIKGGQAIAMIDRYDNQLIIQNLCSHSEFLDTKDEFNDCRACPEDHYSDLKSSECKACNLNLEDLNKDLLYMCKNKETFRPFNTRYELVNFNNDSESNGGFIAIIVIIVLVGCCTCSCIVYFCVKKCDRSRPS